MEELYRHRLEVLADRLENLKADEGFALAWWMMKNPNCGTSACAVGWATTVPEFREAGLGLRKKWGVLEPVYDGATGIDAAAAFFGLSRWEADQLFLECFYPPDQRHDARAVAARLREVAAKRRAA